MNADAPDVAGKVAIITGGASGIGLATARSLAQLGVHVVIGDVNDDLGRQAAEEVGGTYVRTDVRDLQQNIDLVTAAEDTHGGLDSAFLNAGISSPTQIGEDFDVDAYRLAMGVNIDGVVFGVQACLPALRQRGGGSILATSSLAGLTGIPGDAIYGANKHAVVGLVRSLAPGLAGEGIRLNALCPSFADTPIVEPIRETLTSGGLGLITPEAVAEAATRVLTGTASGECWFVQLGREPEPFRFRGIPGPR